MATFAKRTFDAASYAVSRPTYPQKLFDRILAYHKGPRRQCVDLGCGTGFVTRALAPHFDRVLGTDPSPGMIKQARAAADHNANITFQQAPAEKLHMLSAGDTDMLVAGQAAHWFAYDKFWPEAARVVRPGGSFCCWGYKDHIFPDFPKATKILQDYTVARDSELGQYWPQPGRSYVQDHLRIVQPPKEHWSDVERIEYEPGTNGLHSGQGEPFMDKVMTVGACKEYMRTWSCTHGWMEAHPNSVARSRGGDGDVVDFLIDEISRTTPYFADEDGMINVEWGWGMVFARRNE